MPRLQRPRGRRRRHEIDAVPRSSSQQASSCRRDAVKDERREPQQQQRTLETEITGQHNQKTDVLKSTRPPLPSVIESFMSRRGFEPTPVQQECWPYVLDGRDVIAVAPTGTGKTLAYLLPLSALLPSWSAAQPGRPLALVLVPTRELAQQVTLAATPVLETCSARAVAVYGGADRRAQLEDALRSPAASLLIATPGRLLDLCGLETQPLPAASAGTETVSVASAEAAATDTGETGATHTLCGPGTSGADHTRRAVGACHRQRIDLSSVRFVAIDECDKMVAMGLMPQVSAACGATHELRQTLLLSATFPEHSVAQSTSLQRAPVVTLRLEAPQRTSVRLPSNITQHVEVSAEHKKPRKLLRLLDKLSTYESTQPDGAAQHGAAQHGAAQHGADQSRPRDGRVMIFANKIKTVGFIMDLLSRHHVRAESLTSQRSQAERDAALRAFADGAVRVLVATDLAARGLHLPSLRVVVLWDFGTNLEQYTHRVGRVGRQGARGDAYAFFTRNLRPLAPAVVELLREHAQKVDPQLLQLADEARGALENDETCVQSDGIHAPACALGSASQGSAESGKTLKDRKSDVRGFERSIKAASSISKFEKSGTKDRERPMSEGSAGAPKALSRSGMMEAFSGADWLSKHLVSPITGKAAVFSRDGLRLKRKAGKNSAKTTAKKKRVE